MFADSINTVKFNITCTNQITASDMERAIMNGSVNNIAEILEQIGVERNEAGLKQIDKIEIDLGNITAKAFSNFTFNNQLKEILHKELTKHSELKHIISTNDAPVEDSLLARRDLIKEFLSFGDLPWWANKNSYYALNEILQKLLLQSPAVILPVLADIKNNASAIFRLKTQFSLATAKMLEEIIPGVYDADNNMQAADKTDGSADQPHVHALLKETLSWLLIQKPEQHVLNFMKHLDNLTQAELNALQTYFDINDTSLRTKVQAVFLKLTLPQLSFLWQAVNLKLPQAETKNNNIAVAPAISKQLPRLAKKLKTNETALRSLFQTFSTQELQALEKSINWDVTENRLKHLLADLIAAQPELLKRAILKINTAVLSSQDILMAEHILWNEEKEHQSGRKLLTRLLKKLPIADIRTIVQFAMEGGSHSFQFATREAKKIIVENAGLCILAPYLPALFNHLNYLHNNRFKNVDLAYRALLLLQYVAAGTHKYPEYALQFNKLLCGFNPTDAVPTTKRLKATEKQEADDLLLAVIGNWVVLKNTSADSLRTSFLQRKGLLFESEFTWTLQIEKKAYDVLLDSIPWAFNLIKLPWMKKAIQIEW